MKKHFLILTQLSELSRECSAGIIFDQIMQPGHAEARSTIRPCYNSLEPVKGPDIPAPPPMRMQTEPLICIYEAGADLAISRLR